MDKQNEMEAFVAVVREGGFSAAGRKLGLTPSALSKQVSRLEDRLGVSLLHRNTRGIQLTGVGRAYYDRGRAIVRQIAELEDSVAESHGPPRGVVRVSMSPGLVRFQLVDMLADFHRRYPDIRLVLELSDRFVDLVEQGIDVAVRVGNLGDSSLIARKIAPFARVIVASPAYLEAHGTPRTPRDLLSHNCLMLSINQRTMNRWEFQGPKGIDIIEVSGSLEASTVETLQDAAEAGIGIARVFPLLAARGLAEGRVVALLTEFTASPGTALHVVYPSTRHLSGAARLFIDELVAFLTEAMASVADVGRPT